MRIESLLVRNFRAIREQSVDLEDNTVLIGRNGSGKSTFLRALDFFYTTNFGITREDFHYQIAENPIEVTITYVGLSERAKEEFKSYIRQDKLIITKKAVMVNDTAVETYHGTRPRCADFDDVRGLSDKRAKTRTFNELVDAGTYDGLERANSADAVDEQLAAWEDAHPDRCSLTLDDGKFFGFKSVGTGKLDKYTDLIPIPAVRDASQEATEARDNALKKLMDIAVRATVSTQEIIKDFRRRVIQDYDQILAREEFNLGPLHKHLDASLRRYAPRASVNLAWEQLSDPKLPNPTAFATLIEDGFENSIGFMGHGLQRTFVISILHLLAEIQAGIVKLKETESNDGIPGLILTLEEPELYQHPSQARFLAKTLKGLTSNSSGDASFQVLSTSHSPLYVSIESFDQIRVIRKAKSPEHRESERNQTIVSRATLADVAGRLERANQAKQPFTPEGVAARLVTLLNPYVNEGFFADFVVLVEGEEDRAFLMAAITNKVGFPGLEENGIVIVPVNGKNNLDKMKAILDLLGIPNHVIFDTDADKTGASERVSAAKANTVIQQLCGNNNPIEFPNTTFSETYSALNPNMTVLFEQDVTNEKWERLREEVGAEYGYLKPSLATKNPVVLAEMLGRLGKQGKSSGTLDAILKTIASAYVKTVGQLAAQALDS